MRTSNECEFCVKAYKQLKYIRFVDFNGSTESFFGRGCHLYTHHFGIYLNSLCLRKLQMMYKHGIERHHDFTNLILQRK